MNIPGKDPGCAVLALGANLGDRAETLKQAVDDISAHHDVKLLRRSPLVQTQAVGGPPGQPPYLNMVIEVETTLSPKKLLEWCHEVEAKHHRERQERWGPRTLDIDLIVYRIKVYRQDPSEGDDYAEIFSHDPKMTLPHPRAAERLFVLVPWLKMDPDATLAWRPVVDLAAEAQKAAQKEAASSGQDVGKIEILDS